MYASYNAILTSILSAERLVADSDATVLRTISQAEYFVLVGSSGAGKTSALQVAQKLPELFSIPLRYTTRDKRQGDNGQSIENVYLSKKEFMKRTQAGEVLFPWKRYLSQPKEGKKEVWYGFSHPTSSDKIQILSGNNQFYRQRDQLPQDTLEKMVFIEITAPKETRNRRILARSPGLSTQERGQRVQDQGLGEEFHGIKLANAYNNVQAYEQGVHHFSRSSW